MAAKTYREKGYEYWWDKNCRHWVLYPINKDGLRIEWDKAGEPIECADFPNKSEVTIFLRNNKNNYE